MKVKIYKDKVIDAISNVQGITGRKSNLIVSTCILIKAVKDNFYISANDSETGFEGFYPAVVEEEGEAIVNSRKFFEIIKEYPDNEILITKLKSGVNEDEEDDSVNVVKIGNEQIEFNIVSLDDEEFVSMPDIEEPEFFSIKSSYLKDMIDKIHMISHSPDDKRAYILGIDFEIVNNEEEKIIRLVSTDGSRLSKYDYILDKDFKMPSSKSILVPKRGINELYKFLNDEYVEIGLDKSNFILKKDNETLVIRLLEGAFPNYENIFLREGYCDVKINKEKFSMMIKRMSILSLVDYKGVVFNFKEDKLVISAENPEIGESREDIYIEFKGNPFSVAFNPKFFLELISVIKDENIILYLKDDESSCIIEGEENKSFKTVIMPMVM